jgi:hypothetical protein
MSIFRKLLIARGAQTPLGRSRGRLNWLLVFVGEKKWENSEAVHQLFIDFKKAYDSVRR